MKNWLIGKLGGVPKQIYMATVEGYTGALVKYSKRLFELDQENTAITKRNYNLEKESAGMKAEKAEMEKATEMVSENLSETISRLNDEKRTSNGLMAKMTAQAQKIEELQAEIEAKNAELARVKSEIIAISKVKADTTLKAENQRLKAELELLKRRKGRK